MLEGQLNKKYTQWITLFDDQGDDEYDGALGLNDDEEPRVLFEFTLSEEVDSEQLPFSVAAPLPLMSSPVKEEDPEPVEAPAIIHQELSNMKMKGNKTPIQEPIVPSYMAPIGNRKTSVVRSTSQEGINEIDGNVSSKLKTNPKIPAKASYSSLTKKKSMDIQETPSPVKKQTTKIEQHLTKKAPPATKQPKHTINGI